MTRYLLDTNHIGEAIGRVSVVRDRIQQMHRQGDLAIADRYAEVYHELGKAGRALSQVDMMVAAMARLKILGC